MQQQRYATSRVGQSAVAAYVLLAVAAVAVAESTGSGPVATAPAVRVQPQYVCMVNNRRYATAQTPVIVQDRTYYGCCEMCEAKLRADAAIREATDPVSGKAVDKALATIGSTPSGTVYYFESEANLEAFNSGGR